METGSKIAAPQIPGAAIFKTIIGLTLAQSLLVATELDVAAAIGDQGATPDTLAEEVGAHAAALTRILRLLATQGIFEERDGRIYNTPASDMLRKDHPQSRREVVRVTQFLVKPVLEGLGYAVRTGRPAVEILDPDGVWSWLAKNPALGRMFDDLMASRSTIVIPAVLATYDFTEYGTIADIGGGRGHLIRAVLSSAPRAQGIAFDLPHVIADANFHASERLTLQGGDFFRDPLPAADAYLLMHIIHDWSDSESLTILKAVRKAAPLGSKLLVIEQLVPEAGAVAALDPLFVTAADVSMMVTSSGRERRLSEYQSLLVASGWCFERTLPVSLFAIIESVAA